MPKKVLACAAILCVGLVLTGCTPAVRGLVGVTLSDSGAPIAIFAPCEGEVDAMLLYESNGGRVGDEVARWDFKVDREQFKILPALAGTDRDTRFELRAWSDQDKRLNYTWFRIADLEALEEGEVLFGDPTKHDVSLVGSEGEFLAAACPET